MCYSFSVKTDIGISYVAYFTTNKMLSVMDIQYFAMGMYKL